MKYIDQRIDKLIVVNLKLEGTRRIKLDPKRDTRGYFMETYRQDVFEKHKLVTDWVQENRSLSTQIGTIRGLHFQLPPFAETKLVSVLAGRILDVFVDLRKSSPTYGCWDAQEIDGESYEMLYIPKGFAHGFCTLEEMSLVSYKVDQFYNPKAQAGIAWNDPELAIPWPAELPIISPKDGELPNFNKLVSPF